MYQVQHHLLHLVVYHSSDAFLCFGNAFPQNILQCVLEHSLRSNMNQFFNSRQNLSCDHESLISVAGSEMVIAEVDRHFVVDYSYSSGQCQRAFLIQLRLSCRYQNIFNCIVTHSIN